MVKTQIKSPSPTTLEITTFEVEEWRPTRALYLALTGFFVLIAVVAMEATSLSVALPIMSRELNGTALQAFWCGTGFSLANAVMLPSFASMSDIFGRKRVLLASCTLFLAGSLVAGLAQDFRVVLIGRILMGIGGTSSGAQAVYNVTRPANLPNGNKTGGGNMVISEMVLVDLVPLAKRGSYIGLFSLVWAIGTMTGPLIGAGFAQNITWRWIFLINLPTAGAALILLICFLNQTKIPGDFRSKVSSFDWIGSLLFTVSSTSFLYGLTTGGVMYDWSSYQVLLSVLLGLLGMAFFLVWEYFFAVQTLFEAGIFTNTSLIAAYIGVVLQGATIWALAYYGVLFYQGGKLYSPITSALAFLPETVTSAPIAGITGVIATRTQRYRWALWSGWVFLTAGMGMLYLLNPDISVPGWIFLNIPAGIGVGLLFTSQMLAIQAAVEPAFAGAATGFFSFLRVFGQSIGIATAGVIFQNSFQRKLEAIPAFAPLAVEYSRDATTVISVVQGMSDGDDRDLLRQAYADALKIVWLSLTGYAAAGLLLSLKVKSFTINQEHVSNQKLVQQHKLGIINEITATKDKQEA